MHRIPLILLCKCTYSTVYIHDKNWTSSFSERVQLEAYCSPQGAALHEHDEVHYIGII